MSLSRKSRSCRCVTQFSHLRKRMMPLPACSSSLSVVLESSDRQFGEHRIDVKRQHSPTKVLSSDQGCPRVGKAVQDNVSCSAARSHEPFNCRERLLRIAPRYVFFQSIEYLLDIHPHVARTNILRLATLQVLRPFAIHLFVVSPEDSRDVGVCNREVWIPVNVVEELLSNPHPVFLSSIASLVSQGYEIPRTEAWQVTHHDHEVRQRLKVVTHVGSQPDIEVCIVAHGSNTVFDPLPRKLHVVR